MNHHNTKILEIQRKQKFIFHNIKYGVNFATLNKKEINIYVICMDNKGDLKEINIPSITEFNVLKRYIEFQNEKNYKNDMIIAYTKNRNGRILAGNKEYLDTKNKITAIISDVRFCLLGVITDTQLREKVKTLSKFLINLSTFSKEKQTRMRKAKKMADLYDINIINLN